MKMNKSTKFASLLAIALLSTPLPTHAQDKIAQLQQIQFRSEIIEISALEFAKIMSAPTDSSDRTTLRNKLIKQVKAGKATLVSRHSIISQPDQRSVIESITKFSYPTEYESPAVIKVKNTQEQPKYSAPKPKDFETRNLGTTIILTHLLVPDNKSIDTTFAADIVKHVGDNVYAEWVTKGAKKKSKVTTPKFFTCRLNTSLIFSTGEFILVGTYTPELDGKPDNTKKLLHFINANIL